MIAADAAHVPGPGTVTLGDFALILAEEFNISWSYLSWSAS